MATLNFAVGPVMSDEQTLKVAAEQLPYFRTDEFSYAVKTCENNIKNLFDAAENNRTVFLTGSGTSAMEAVVMNVLSKDDRVIAVNGGTFGERFCEMLSIHGIDYTEIACIAGHTLTGKQLYEIDGSKHTAFIVNLCETSTGVLYDIDMISAYCKKHNLLLIVDAISAFLCDGFSMRRHGIDVAITGSQKALGLAPGLAITCFSSRAIERINHNRVCSLYFDLKRYLKDGERGQTPFTPAVGIVLQLLEKTNRIIASGGITSAIDCAKANALYFRDRVGGLPVKFFADKSSNAVTALAVGSGINAYDIFLKLKNEYDIFVCPNGGELKEKVLRVGHMGNIAFADYDRLVGALENVF